MTQVVDPGNDTGKEKPRFGRLESSASAPVTIPLAPDLGLDDPRSYRIKRKLLGPPLHTDQMEHQRLGKPTALAVFASDALSSTAYATEEIIRAMVPVIGAIAFSLYLLPITMALVAVLVILMFSYRQTIKAYPSAGGAYIVTKDNLGLLPAQVAGVALLTDYILTVAVSVSAGVAALYSAAPAVYAYRVPVALFFIAIIAWGNLRGVKESGRLFAVPTYLFIVSMFTMIIIGLVRGALHGFHHVPVPVHPIPIGTKAVYVFLILKGFASGGAAMTGVEAISNGVPAFKKPEWKNARSTLMIMGACLGSMFLGISFLAAKFHTLPSEKSTVISEIAKATFGTSAAGHFAFLFVQGATMLILVLAANTSFADFPRLASFHANDHFMPKQLTKRGHRLVFSNGIVFLAIAAGILVVIFQANVTHLIPLYAIGVFTSFTLSQAGMAKRHLRLREQGWKLGLLINGGGSFATFVVTIVIGIVKFAHGAWFIMLLVPIMVALLVRLNRQYESEHHDLEFEVREAATAPVLRRHVALLLVDSLDRSTAQGITYARSLNPDEVRAVHVAIDPEAADALMDDWLRLGITRFSLELVDCPDRRLVHSVTEVVAEILADGQTEVTVVIARREYRHFWHRFLHDHTADDIARGVSRLRHANVTFVPYHLGEDHAKVDAAAVLGVDA